MFEDKKEVMFPLISINEALLMPQACFFDLRSPQEFAEGSIPGAVNIPIFSNAERIEIGILYKEKGAEAAKTRGLEIASTKLPSIIQQITTVSGNRNVIVYCWRGGLRSRSIAAILHLMGISVYQLSDGYKAYRQYVLNRLADYKILPCFIVLQGLTGTGKTLLLKELGRRGLPVIDLEEMANHRGSVFGRIGKGQTISAKNFDALILEVLDKYQKERYVFIEAESKRIGNIYVPDCVMKSMRHGKRILLTASLPTRVQRLLDEYLQKDRDTCVDQHIALCLEMLQSRLGKAKTAQLQELLRGKNYPMLVEILLREYYDPLYNYSEQDAHNCDLHVSSEDICAAADCIIDFLYGGGN